MAYIDKLTTLQRFVAWHTGSVIEFEGVLIDEHILVGRYISGANPLLYVDLSDEFNDLDTIFQALEWKIIDKPKEIEPRKKFKERYKRK